MEKDKYVLTLRVRATARTGVEWKNMKGSLLSKYVVAGNKVDIRAVREEPGKEGKTAEVYFSQVYDVLSEDRMEIIMPTEKTKLVLLPVGAEYALFFYTEGGVYQCKAKVIGREKRKNTYLLIMELISNLRKEQRREFYRFSCALDMNSRVVEEEDGTEVPEPDGEGGDAIDPKISLKRSIIVDISGGGLRFVSDYSYEAGSTLLCTYQLETKEGVKKYEIMGNVLSVKEMENKPGVFEHRVQYLDIDNEAREEIIKFIFEEERKILKKMD